MSDDVALPLEFTDAAANKVKSLIADEDNPNLKLRVYITGGGCSGLERCWFGTSSRFAAPADIPTIENDAIPG